MIFDSHAHYDSGQFDEDRDEILNSMQENGVGTIVNSAADWDSVTEVVELAEKYPFVYAAVGLHPDEVGDLDEERFAYLKAQCQKEKVVAVGEIGLDYYWDNESHDVQKKWFIRQLELARELDLPVIIHSRDAAEDTLKIMKEHGQGLRGVIHCFSYSKELAREYVKMGFYIGVGGVVTFKNGKKLKEIVEEIPLERILLETDCPYLAPVPFRGKRNSSLYIPYIAEEIANLKGVTYEEVVAQTELNAKKLFGII
ncbi:MAG: TatD family hydrolase [Tyzzerella sp.]|nr:TatD family hydrolase [Tyzzerella sp.]